VDTPADTSPGSAPEWELAAVEFDRLRWGNPAFRTDLPDRTRELVSVLAPEAHTSSAPTADSLAPPTTALSPDVMAALESAVGTEHVATDDLSRVKHTRGSSFLDVMRLRGGDTSDAPDVVVRPGSPEDVEAVLAVCVGARVAVVPYAGGTSVVGGLTPDRAGYAGVVSLDLGRLDQVLDIDPVSRIATIQAGTRGPDAERALNAAGFTLGHFPQSYEGATIGGYAAARSAGQSSAGYGRFDDMVVGLSVTTPAGRWQLGNAPKSASGPDLRHLVLGSEGTLGVITEVRVRIRELPEERRFEAWRFEDFEAGSAAMRHLAQEGLLPAVLRLSDETETAGMLADPRGEVGEAPHGCLVITGFEGSVRAVDRRHAAVSEALEELGGWCLGPDIGEAWRVGRFHAPYNRDPLIDAGVLVETLETVTFWSQIPRLKGAVTQAVTDALTAQGTPPLVYCHISHVYETGASLYFTVTCAQNEDPIAQWRAAKAAGSAAIRECGAASTHHHGIGTDHRDIFAEEIGPVGLAVLRAVKSSVDPQHVLNPGVLLPADN